MSLTAANNTHFAIDNHYYQAGNVNPSVTATDGLAGSIYVQVPVFGSTSPIASWQKQDNGVSVNWTAYAGGGGSGVTTVGVIDSGAKSANGAVISGTTITFQTADGTFPGMLSLVAQVIVGSKGFSQPIRTFNQGSEPANPSAGEVMIYSLSDNLAYTKDSSGIKRVINGIIQDEGSAVKSAPTFINFVGAGVTAAASGNGVTVTIPGTASPLVVETHIVSGGEAAAKQFTLSAVPTGGQLNLSAGGVDQIGGGVDYSLAGAVVSWTGLGLDTIGIVAGDTFLATYE